MMRTPEILLIIGGCINSVLALGCLFGIRHVMDTSRPLTLFIDAKRSSVATVVLRKTFLYSFFVACTLIFPAEMLQSRFGVLVTAGIGGYLALVALEEWRLPEYRQFGRPVLAPLGAIAYLGAVVADGI